MTKIITSEDNALEQMFADFLFFDNETPLRCFVQNSLTNARETPVIPIDAISSILLGHAKESDLVRLMLSLPLTSFTLRARFDLLRDLSDRAPVALIRDCLNDLEQKANKKFFAQMYSHSLVWSALENPDPSVLEACSSFCLKNQGPLLSFTSLIRKAIERLNPQAVLCLMSGQKMTVEETGIVSYFAVREITDNACFDLSQKDPYVLIFKKLADLNEHTFLAGFLTQRFFKQNACLGAMRMIPADETGDKKIYDTLKRRFGQSLARDFVLSFFEKRILEQSVAHHVTDAPRKRVL